MPKGIYKRGQPKILLECEWCGKDIERIPSRLEKVKHNFCSIKCRSKWHERFYIYPYRGEKHYNWKGGKGKSYARTVTRRLGRISCEYVEHDVLCNSRENIEVHHIDGNQNNNLPENLLVLCYKHHRKVEGLDKMLRNEMGQFIKRRCKSKNET